MTMEDEKKPCIYKYSCLFPQCDPTKCEVYTPKEQGMEFYKRYEPKPKTLHKLIWAGALYSSISWYNHHECGGISVSDVVRELYNAPAVDVVDVVECKDCKHYEAPDEGDALGRCRSGRLAVSSNGEIYPEPDYFCPYGERKDK